MKESRLFGAACTLSLSLFSSHAAAVSLEDYMVVTSLAYGDGDAFIMSNSEIGAIGENGSTSPPGSLPTLPGGTVRTVSTGITLDGDAAITNGGKVSFSNSDVNALNTGPSNPGSQGVDCDATYAICTVGGGNIGDPSSPPTGNRFNTTDPASYSDIDNNNGIQGSINLSGITSELVNLRNIIGGLDITTDNPYTGQIDLASGLINTDTVWDFTGGTSGLNVIDIETNGNDLSITGANLTIKGDADDFIIFRVSSSWVMDVSESRLLLDGDIGVNNVLWYVDADQGEESFNFDNATFYGMSLWDLGTDTDNVISFNNVQFCGQVITDQVNFQNVSGSGCSFDTSAVPVPAAVWLFGSGLIGLVGIARRKKA